MDSIDLAQDLNDQFLKESLNRAMVNSNDANYIAQERNKKGRVICKNCGELIPKKRLKAIPNAVYCVDCQQEMEEKNRQ